MAVIVVHASYDRRRSMTLLTHASCLLLTKGYPSPFNSTSGSVFNEGLLTHSVLILAREAMGRPSARSLKSADQIVIRWTGALIERNSKLFLSMK